MESSLSGAKILAQFQWCHPQLGAKYRSAMLKSPIFDDYRAVSQKRRKIRDIRLLLKARRNFVCALSNSAISSDP